MALTDIVDNVGIYQNAENAARGNVGTLVDIIGKPNVERIFQTQPTIAQVQSGVQYGQQGTELTGTFSGGGGSGGIRLAGHGGLAS